MVILSCSVPGCNFETLDLSDAVVIALLSNHGYAHQLAPGPAPAAPSAGRGPKLERPKIDVGVSNEEWNIFVRRWGVFRSGSGMMDLPSQLFQCAGTVLGDALLRSDPDAVSGTLDKLMGAMRALAVIPVAPGVLRSDLLQLRQERD